MIEKHKQGTRTSLSSVSRSIIDRENELIERWHQQDPLERRMTWRGLTAAERRVITDAFGPRRFGEVREVG